MKKMGANHEVVTRDLIKDRAIFFILRENGITLIYPFKILL